MDELRPFKCDSGQIYLFPKKHCVFCNHCYDLLYDYTNGPYCFFCDLGLCDHETCGQFKEEVMPAEKYLSIITNFGCHFKCPYCVVKNNDIKVPFTTIESLDHLKASVESEGATIISVSGGGDPLHNDRRDIFNMCLECYQDKLHKVNKVDYSFILDGFKIKFITPYNEQTYLQGRRNVVLTDTCHVRPFLEKEIERRKQNGSAYDHRKIRAT